LNLIGTSVDLMGEEGAVISADLARRPLIDIVFDTAIRRPGHSAVIDSDGLRRATYRDFVSLVRRWAGRLTALGVVPGDPVAISTEADMSAPLGFLAILAAGGVVVPLDPALPASRRREMAEAVGCRLQLGLDGTVPFSADIDPGDEPAPVVPHDPARTALIFHTSGSTGRPKPVALPHSALSARMLSMREWFGFDENDVVGAGSSHAFDPFIQQLFLPLIAGGTMWIPDRPTLLDAPRFAGEARTVGLTHLNLVPSQIGALLKGDAGGPIPTLRRVVMGGERMPVDLPARIVAAFGPCAVFNMYGPTEAMVDATGERVELPVVGTEIPIGRVLPGCRVRVLNEALERVPPGEPGELCIGGVGLATGYIGAPETTAERFASDPFGAPGDRLYRTGDVVRWLPGGKIGFIGRRDEQVKIRGRRLELGEVETAIRSFPGVIDAAVKVWADAPGGPGLVAHVVGLAFKAEGELREHLARRLVDAAVPARFLFPAALPTSPSGKIDKRALPDPGPEAPVPAPTRSVSALERSIVGVWSRLLRRSDIDVNANLFEMGAHSLLIPEALEAIREATGTRPDAVDLFRYPTVASLAKALSGSETISPAKRSASSARGPIAVIGVAARMPGAATFAEFERLVFSGEVAARRYDRETLLGMGAPVELIDHPDFVPVHAPIEGADLFDAALFGIGAGEAAEIDPQQRLLLELSFQALEDAACDTEVDGPVGVFAGIGFNTYMLDNLRGRTGFAGGFERYSVVVSADKDFAATRVAYKLGLTGPAFTVASACSTALSAVAAAVDSLRLGRCRVAVAGAASLGMFSRFGHIASEGGIASKSGVCRPFDAAADGLTAGAGAGVLVLKRLEDAEEDGDRILGVILGVGVGNDGARKAAFAAPSVEGQAAAIALALEDANVGPDQIGFVEAHGTGTALGDPIEVAALNSVFAGSPSESVGLGSIKGAIGHLDAAAGIAGLLAGLAAVRRGEIPPTAGFSTPNPRIPFDKGPFRVSDAVEPWPAGRSRIAGVSGFGMGGTNVHVVLAAPPPAREPATDRGPVLSTVSAPSAAAADELVAAIKNGAGPGLADTAAALARRRAHPHRRAVVARDANELSKRVWIAGEARGAAPLVAFSFPGQGAQRPGMARSLHDAFPVYREVIERARLVLADTGLANLLDPLLADRNDRAAADALTRTEFTQPALFIVESATAALLRSFGVIPGVLIGHSVGEIVAAHVAGVMDFDAALRLVVARGRLMGSTAPGVMIALSLPESEAAPLIAAAGADLAAINGPRQCVASGPENAIAELERAVERLGRPTRRLPVSRAFHSALMEPILEAFADEVGKIETREPLIPVVSNLSGAMLTGADARDPAYWARHLRGAVRLVDGLRTLRGLSDDVMVVEAGPGDTLTRSARAAGFAEARVTAVDPDPAVDGREGFLTALGRLWVAGVEIDRRAAAGLSNRRHAAPPTPMNRVRHWIEPGSAETRSIGTEAGTISTPIAGRSGTLDVVLREWRDVLGAPNLGADDDFFELGGDSLIAVRLTARLRRELGCEMTVADLFQARTAGELARGLGETTVRKSDETDEREEGLL